MKPFVDQMGNKMDYRVVIDTNGSANHGYMNKYSIQGIPHSFVVDKNAQVVYHGHPMEPEFESTLQKCIKEHSKPKIDLSTLTSGKIW